MSVAPRCSASSVSRKVSVCELARTPPRSLCRRVGPLLAPRRTEPAAALEQGRRLGVAAAAASAPLDWLKTPAAERAGVESQRLAAELSARRFLRGRPSRSSSAGTAATAVVAAVRVREAGRRRCACASPTTAQRRALREDAFNRARTAGAERQTRRAARTRGAGLPTAARTTTRVHGSAFACHRTRAAGRGRGRLCLVAATVPWGYLSASWMPYRGGTPAGEAWRGKCGASGLHTRRNPGLVSPNL